ncbi:MAG: carbohydrate kinase [Planctomycetes bacterium]|nr:carbohydrate kinase [Planctomycetota bacterium]
MNAERFQEITNRFPQLRIGVVGDFCLDRYFEIDPAKSEVSIETGLKVHNVVRVRSQPGAAGTILNNLVALGIGTIHVVGFRGDDGEGYELERALRSQPGVNLDYYLCTPQRRTFVYGKPLVMEPGKLPRELNRLDSKNWTPTPDEVQEQIVQNVREVARRTDVMILMDQVDLPETGVVTRRVAKAVHEAAQVQKNLWVLADSRRGPRDFPPLGFKMNEAEFKKLTGATGFGDIEDLRQQAGTFAQKNGRPVFVTLADRGIVGALPTGESKHVSAHPVRGPIDIVGAGDAVTANLSAAWGAGAKLEEAMTLAMSAASIVIHQLGTTGTASVVDLRLATCP